MPNTHHMRHLEVTLPQVTNHGEQSDYNRDFRKMLLTNGVTGWTEHEFHVGMWKGNREPVNVYTFYVPIKMGNNIRAHLGLWARMAAPDQEVIQVVDHGDVELYEY